MEVATWNWNDDGSVLWYRRGNDIDTTYEYDTVGRQSRARTVDSGSTTIFDVRSEYDKEGNRLTQRFVTGETYWDERYYYDTLYRLEQMKRGHVYLDNGDWVVSNVSRTEDWGLDLLGNWGEYDVSGDESISQDRTHNDLNQITAIDQTSFTYDYQGNLTNDGSQAYVWDIAGHLKQVWTGDEETLKEEAQYDAYGRRVKHWIYTTNDNAYYYYDGWRVIEEWVDPDDDDAFLQARNVWGLYLDETVVRTAHLGEEADQDFYPVLNQIYSPLRIYDQSGNLEVRMKYTPYGKPTAVNADGNPTLAAENIAGMVNHDYPHLFTGQRWDIKTGLSYYKNRYYSLTLGRFLSRDTPRMANRYTYVASMPIRMADPFGLKSIELQLQKISFHGTVEASYGDGSWWKGNYKHVVATPEESEYGLIYPTKSDMADVSVFTIFTKTFFLAAITPWTELPASWAGWKLDLSVTYSWHVSVYNSCCESGKIAVVASKKQRF